MSKKLAVIGYGWLGMAFAQKMQEASHSICGTSTDPEKVAEINRSGMQAIRLELSELQDKEKFRSFFSGVSHCLINIPPKKAGTITYSESCLNLLSLFSDQTKFVFASSTGVYRDTNRTVSENCSEDGYVSDHPIRNAEIALQKRLQNRLTIVRFAGLIGPGRDPATFFSGKKNISNGAVPVNLIQQLDAVEIINRIIEQDCFGMVFNACSDHHPDKQSYYTEKCILSGIEIPEFIKECNEFKVIDSTKSKTRLGMEYSPL